MNFLIQENFGMEDFFLLFCERYCIYLYIYVLFLLVNVIRYVMFYLDCL